MPVMELEQNKVQDQKNVSLVMVRVMYEHDLRHFSELSNRRVSVQHVTEPVRSSKISVAPVMEKNEK